MPPLDHLKAFAMTTITCYLDFISPYAYLAFEALPKSLMGVSHRMVYKPVLFAGMLKHHGQLGPAEIAGKREWTYRQVMWQAKQMGVQLDMPLVHPFNPLALLRLAVACSADGEPNRYVCETIFKHVWQGGAAADDAVRLLSLTQQLSPQRLVDASDVKDQLKANTEEAIARGVFGVPTFCVGDKVFWGLDSLPMMRTYLDGDRWFETHWQSVALVNPGLSRTKSQV
jgi:2-hydroxychromene-2-carboxylate isomerase